jgi:O-succinylbenzoate synthase
VPISTDARILLHHLDIPMRGEFHTAQAHVGTRSIGLVEMVHEGVTGWGEASPFPGQDESMDDVVAAVDTGGMTSTLSAGINQAGVDWSARNRGVSIADEVGATLESVPASMAIGLGADPVAAVGRAAAAGMSRFKIKIGPGHVDHVVLIRAANESCVLGVDANGSFDQGTIGELAVLADLEIAYIEQPCDGSDTPALTTLKSLVDVPVFADESIRSKADGESVLASPLIDGAVVKPGRLGFDGALGLIELAERLGKRWRASGLLETGIGRAYTDILAAIPSAFVSDVASADWFFERDVAPSRFSDGSMSTPTGPGIGVVPSAEVLERYLVATHEVGAR